MVNVQMYQDTIVPQGIGSRSFSHFVREASDRMYVHFRSTPFTRLHVVLSHITTKGMDHINVFHPRDPNNPMKVRVHYQLSLYTYFPYVWLGYLENIDPHCSGLITIDENNGVRTL